MDIDFVILWVDGSDPAWLKEKMVYQPEGTSENSSIIRYRDWGILKYWFRSIEKFTPWVRTIHFVTWGHLPHFLNINHPKLHIVKHNEFIPTKYLPTFSSHAIELNIHRISNLAEHFVYFNDDTFLLKPMKKSDFFRGGFPCICGTEIPLQFEGKLGVWQHVLINDMGVINKNFCKKIQIRNYAKKYVSPVYRWQDNIRTKLLEILYPDNFLGFPNQHAPNAFIRNTFEELWKASPELLDMTCKHRFRSSDDLNQWVALWWQVAGGKFSPYMIDNVVAGVNKDTIDMMCDIIQNQKHVMVCLNDSDDDIDFEKLSQKLKMSFESLLPEKSKFEK